MFQIINTLRCNFKCDHCMFACTRKGEDMSYETFGRALQFGSYGGDEFLNFLGGEPFLHKEVFDQIERISWFFSGVNLRIVTNGSWVLSKNGNPSRKFYQFYDLMEQTGLAERTSMLVSDDWWHDEFLTHSVRDIKNVLRRTGVTLEDDNRKINNYVIPLGRAVKTGVGSWKNRRTDQAECVEIFDPSIMPNGDITACCNSQGVIGNLYDYYNVKDVFESCEEKWRKIYYEKNVCQGDCLTCKKWTKKKLNEL